MVFLPEEAYPLILVLLAIAVIAGVARSRLLVGFILFLVLSPLIAELALQLIVAMPLWVVVMVGVGLVTWFLRTALSVVLGRNAADQAVGALAADLIKVALRILLLPFRLVGWLLRRRRVVTMLLVVAAASACGPSSRKVNKAVAKRIQQDLVRDFFTKSKRLPAPRTVFRYMSSQEAKAARTQGIDPGRHFTATARPGRPWSSSSAVSQLGLPVAPTHRATVRLFDGTPVKANKVLGGSPGRGELKVMKQIPPNQVVKIVPIPR